MILGEMGLNWEKSSAGCSNQLLMAEQGSGRSPSTIPQTQPSPERREVCADTGSEKTVEQQDEGGRT